MSNSTLLLIDQIDLIGDELRWALRLVDTGGGRLTVIIVGAAGDDVINVEFGAKAADSKVAARVALAGRKAVDDYLGSDNWRPALMGETAVVAGGGESTGEERLAISARIVSREAAEESIIKLATASKFDRLIFVARLNNREEWAPPFRRILRSIPCWACIVIPGSRRATDRVLVTTGRSTHGRAALEAGRVMAEAAGHGMTALQVEPDIGPDSVDVGRRILNRRLGTMSTSAGEIERRVAVHDNPAKAVLEISKERAFDVAVLGATRAGAIGEKLRRSVPAQMLDARPDITLVIVRNPVPLKSRMSLWFRGHIQTHIPQLSRAGRIELVERIQSSSQWNFDFVILMALSTIIAALGLINDSPAVIIGAMLVAPLMTPLLGIGLAVAQGNARLARITFKSATLGFITAYVLGLLIGLLVPEFYEPTAEMVSRNWPRTIDLIIAFASGLAASYASARPSLLAALPGVAIAAALVPPIVSAGLATSIGEHDLALGSLLLFGVNMIAIVAATAIALWSVGVVFVGKASARLRVLGRSFYVAVAVMTLALSISPPQLRPRKELVYAVESVVEGEYRMRRVRLATDNGVPVVQMDIGGLTLPTKELAQSLLKTVREILGEDAVIRLTFRYEGTFE